MITAGAWGSVASGLWRLATLAWESFLHTSRRLSEIFLPYSSPSIYFDHSFHSFCGMSVILYSCIVPGSMFCLYSSSISSSSFFSETNGSDHISFLFIVGVVIDGGVIVVVGIVFAGFLFLGIAASLLVHPSVYLYIFLLQNLIQHGNNCLRVCSTSCVSSTCQIFLHFL